MSAADSQPNLGPAPPIPSTPPQPYKSPPPIPDIADDSNSSEDYSGSQGSESAKFQPALIAYVRDHFLRTFTFLGVDHSLPLVNEALDREFYMMLNFYSEPQRHYHTLQHIGDCLKQFDCYTAWCDHHQADNSNNFSATAVSTRSRCIILLAIFYHDIIYDPKSPRNEG